MEKKRPVGVTVLGIMITLVGIFYLFDFLQIVEVLGGLCYFSYLLRILSQFSLSLFTITGIGILFQRDWARKLTLILSVYYPIFFIYDNVRGTHWFPWAFSVPDFWTMGVLPMLVCIISVIYLTHPKVKELFK